MTEIVPLKKTEAITIPQLPQIKTDTALATVTQLITDSQTVTATISIQQMVTELKTVTASVSVPSTVTELKTVTTTLHITNMQLVTDMRTMTVSGSGTQPVRFFLDSRGCGLLLIITVPLT